ncbi:MAG: RNA polymerase sigma-70 factor [Cyclobacteriaceae bacterium]
MKADTPIAPITSEDFQKLYFEFFPKAVNLGIYIIKDTSSAEDVAQNVFLKLWGKRAQLSEISNLGGYIMQMTRNACFDWMEKNPTPSDTDIQLEFEDSNSDDESQQIKQALERALSKLAPQCRLIFSLSRFEGLTNPEIAEYLSISTRTVETQVSMALKKFRSDLRHYFIDFLGLGMLLSSLIA